jgi:hypothetical protein
MESEGSDYLLVWRRRVVWGKFMDSPEERTATILRAKQAELSHTSIGLLFDRKAIPVTGHGDP